MGTGKTVICLALILATKGELPSLASVRTDLDGTPSPPPVIMTPIALTLPFASYHSESLRGRHRVPAPLEGYERSTLEIEHYNLLLDEQARSDALEAPKPIPTLRTLLIHLIRSRAVAYANSPALEGSGLFDELSQNAPFYHLYPSPAQLERSREGRKGTFVPVKILVSTASLVVVPTDLVRQWKGELEEHIERDRLNVLVLRTTKDTFPEPQVLATYDAVILSVARFSDAANELDSPLRQVRPKSFDFSGLTYSDMYFLEQRFTGSDSLSTRATHCPARTSCASSPRKCVQVPNLAFPAVK